MPNARAQQIAEILARASAQSQVMGGQPGEPGLESPPGQKILENLGTVAGGYATGGLGTKMAQALAAKGIPAMQAMGEAGAIFPEGMPITGQSKQAISELQQLLTDTEMNYRRNEAMANWHAQMGDFPRVLADKWALLKHAGGS